MIDVAQRVARALAEGRPVVALESTLICHGIPQPRNVALAFEIEQAVREAGAEPATIAVLDGRVKVGLDRAELEHIASTPRVTKCSTRDLSRIMAAGLPGATTVAATIFVAGRTGIKVMATGGLGGVHHGAESTMDISADLDELARTRMIVVCCGIKAILDGERTLERLETLGVPIVGHRCAELPGFYTAETGLQVPMIEDLDGLCRLAAAHEALGLPGGLVVVQPPPAELAMPKTLVDRLVAAARSAARREGIRGAAETPFMLRHMADHSDQATVKLNCGLAIDNARLAGQLVVALAQRETSGESHRTENDLTF
jgi:pseudouridine-5'-phosphate glycosidase